MTASDRHAVPSDVDPAPPSAPPASAVFAEAICDATPDLIAVVQRRGGIELVNNGGLLLAGRTADDGGASHLGELFTPATWRLIRDVGMPAVIADGAWHDEGQLVNHVTAAVVDVDLRVVAIQHGRKRRFLVRAADVTSLKQLDRVRRTFIADAAHELRTPLTALAGLAMTLRDRRDSLTEELFESCLQAIADQGERTRALIDHLLDFARLEGQDETGAAPVALAEVVGWALTAVGDQLDHRVRCDIAEDAVALGDPIRIGQVVVNLLTNAHRYGGSLIDIRAARRGDEVLLVVEDDGDGVPVGVRERIFEAFSRGPNPHPHGSGLGLAIVRRIVEHAGGAVWLEQVDPHGARFCVRLPSAYRQPAEA